MTPSTPLSCAHCDRPVDGPTQHYCPHCGQPTPPHRIDWHFLGHELEHSVLHMDRGLLFTLRELMLRPGRLLRGYLAGRRHGHAKSLLLLTVTAAVVVLAMRGVELLHPGVQSVLVPVVDGSPGHAAVNAWLQRYYTLFTLALLPLEAACFRLAFGRGAGLNYPEWLVVATFVTVQTFVLQLVGLAATTVWPQGAPAFTAAVLPLSVLYGCVSMIGMLAPRPAWRVGARALAGYVLFLAASALLTVVVTSTAAVAQRVG